MATKNLVVVIILVFLVAGAAFAGDNGESSPDIYYASEEDLIKATRNYLVLYSYAAVSDNDLVFMVALDNPDTLEVGDAMAVFKDGELYQFWQLIEGNFKMVFSAEAQMGTFI